METLCPWLHDQRSKCKADGLSAANQVLNTHQSVLTHPLTQFHPPLSSIRAPSAMFHRIPNTHITSWVWRKHSSCAKALTLVLTGGRDRKTHLVSNYHWMVEVSVFSLLTVCFYIAVDIYRTRLQRTWDITHPASVKECLYVQRVRGIEEFCLVIVHWPLGFECIFVKTWGVKIERTCIFRRFMSFYMGWISLCIIYLIKKDLKCIKDISLW